MAFDAAARLTLHLSKDLFKEGDNEVVINDSVSFTVTVNGIEDKIIDKTTIIDYTPILVASICGGAGLLIAGGAVLAILLIRRKKKNAPTNN